jgi:hypothetical protein
MTLRDAAAVVRRRADSERQTLKDLQDAANGLVRVVYVARAEMNAGAETGPAAIDRDTLARFQEYRAAVLRRASRIDDERIRTSCADLADTAQDYLASASSETELELIEDLMIAVVDLCGDRFRSLD